MERDAIATRHTDFIEISTHTLTWSVTLATGSATGQFSISTHTLTWSVTASKAPDAKSREDFNSHAHVERDVHD